MAIIKCDDVVEEQEVITEEGEATQATVEPYVEQDEVSIGKTLIAVESDFFTNTSLKSPLKRDTQAPFLTEKRPSDISDQFRAEFGKFWVQDTSDKESAMVFLNWGLGNQQAHEDWEGIFAPTVFELEEDGELIETPSAGSIGLSTYTQKFRATAIESYFDFENNYAEASDVWTAYTQGTVAVQGSFSRPSPLVPDGQTFTDHAFKMNTPFSKKELEMFANIEGDVSVADVESDYDFFAKAYEEGIASTTVPENALPHLYTEVEKGESNDENTTELPEGYFREFISDVLSDQSEMNRISKAYENVAILDSYMDATYIIDPETKTTSAFEILMSYANRENLFPMNMNIEVNTNNASDVMFNAEDVGMIDDIVRLLMGDGSIFVQTEVPTFYEEGEVEEEVEENQGNNSETKEETPEQEGVEAQGTAVVVQEEESKFEKSEDSESSNGNRFEKDFGKTKGDLDMEIEDFGIEF